MYDSASRFPSFVSSYNSNLSNLSSHSLSLTNKPSGKYLLSVPESDSRAGTTKLNTDSPYISPSPSSGLLSLSLLRSSSSSDYSNMVRSCLFASDL